MKYRISDRLEYEKEVKLYYTEAPNQECQFALQMLERFGLIAARPDGEDTAGRQKGELLPVADTVARAFDLAEEAFRVARARGLMLTLPDLNDVNAEKDAERAARDAKRKEAAAA